MPTYLAACTTYRDHAEYLSEWIEFHRLVGIERFFLYDNGSVDNHLEVLAPYLRDGTAIVHDWPGQGVQTPALNHCLDTHRHDSRWIAFIDIDEFLFSPTGSPLPELLVEYERWPGVGVNLVGYGPSGHRHKPAGFVIENYLLRQRDFRRYIIKNIVQPARVESCPSAHYFDYKDGSAVDELFRPVEFIHTESHSVERFRINHYYTKSLEEFEAKWALPRADNGQLRDHRPNLDRFSVRDEAILIYAPALREAISADRT